VFLRQIGTPGSQAANEYIEGQTVIFSFLPAPAGATEAFCTVTIGQASSGLFASDSGGG
jgi:hypothetical protein